MTDVLTRIVATKREEVEALRSDEVALRRAADVGSAARDFRAALSAGGSVAVMAEVKRRSPGAGPIRLDLGPAELAASYESGGARAVSVLTDREYFGGSLEDLRRVRDRVGLPVLRKDFTIDPLQVFEARAAGADAILLIARILEDGELTALRELAESLGMSALVEAHDATEVKRALGSGARVLGINNRDLRTFTTRLGVTTDLADRIPDRIVLVSESGIRSPDDVRRLGEAGVDAVLVGESLLRQRDPGSGVRVLTGHPRAPRGDG
jgi:indole-3-glycerol phosphate synthase